MDYSERSITTRRYFGRRTHTPLFLWLHLLVADGVWEVVEGQTEVVVAGVVAEVVGGEETTASELPQTVAPDFAAPVHEAAVDPARRSVDLSTQHATSRQTAPFHETSEQ